MRSSSLYWQFGARTRRVHFLQQLSSGLIRSTLPNIAPKHKDNVSRYFNQDFYAYYEINNESRIDYARGIVSRTLGMEKLFVQLRQITRRPLPASDAALAEVGEQAQAIIGESGLLRNGGRIRPILPAPSLP